MDPLTDFALPGQVRLAVAEKRLLVRRGLAVGKGVAALLTACAYPTFRRWVKLYDPASAKPAAPDNGPKPDKGGRPKTPDDVKALILTLAQENAGRGYTRVLKELKKLGVKVSRTTVVNVLKANDIDPKTDPTKGTWGEFVKAHGATLWQCDFFSKHVVTADGVRQAFVLAFLHVQTLTVQHVPGLGARGANS